MVLNVQGLAVPLINTAFGPLPSFRDPDLEALELALQWAVEGRVPEFRRGVEAGEAVGEYPVVARPAGPDDDLTQGRRLWRRLTGHELGDDIYIIHSAIGMPEVAVPRQALLELIDRVSELRGATAKPPGSWLFREIPIWHQPAPGEKEALRQLERQAEQLEMITRAPRTEETRARESVKRRFLLVELNALGILSYVGFADKERWLGAWGLDLTFGYARAARSLHFYFASQGRRLYFPDANDEPVLGARISLDWSRHSVPTPPGREPDEWLGFCEHVLSQATVTGYEGTLLVREGGAWCEVSWRRDDGENPAVFAARVRSSA